MGAKKVTPQQLVDAANTAGWTATHGRFPGEYRLDGTVERPTPDYMLGSTAWPYVTYQDLCQVTFLVGDGGQLTAAFTREGVPWVGVREVKVSGPKALAYIEAHRREPAAAAAGAS
jgi:hypothetical protein